MNTDQPTVNLVKLCVGVQDVRQLETAAQRAMREGRDIWISTRLMPKRKDELLAGGSLYWVISGAIQVRQKILTMESGSTEMGTRVIINLEPKLILTEAHPRRPFQGWRYLKSEDTPQDLDANSSSHHLPTQLERDIKQALAW